MRSAERVLKDLGLGLKEVIQMLVLATG